MIAEGILRKLVNEPDAYIDLGGARHVVIDGIYELTEAEVVYLRSLVCDTPDVV